MKNSSVSLSVIMSVYNDETYLKKAIESIVNQSYPDFEFIIIDDKSTDMSLFIIEDYSKIDKRIIVLKNKKNIGLPASLNRGIKFSSADFIARMDGDDISQLKRFEKQMRFLKKNPQVDIVGTGVLYIDQKGGEIGRKLMHSTHIDLKKEICKNSPFAHPTVIIRREFFNSIGLYDENLKRKQDYHLWVRGVSNSCYANIDEYLLKYRVENSQNTKNIVDIVNIFYVRFLNFTVLKSLKSFFYMFVLPVSLIIELIRSNHVQRKK